MKKSIQSIVAVAAIAFSALTTHAQTAPKILVVDLAKLFDNHWKTQEQQAKLQADAQKKYEEIQQKKGEQNSFIQNTRNTLQQRFQTFKTLMIEEISKAAVEIAKKHGATFLVDKSGPTLVGVSNILYFDPSLDITDEVATELNKDKPAASATPAASTAAPAPAAGDSPKITVPGIK